MIVDGMALLPHAADRVNGKHEASIPAHLIRIKDKDKDKDDPKFVDMDANRPQNKTYRSFFLFLQSLTLTFVLFLAFFDAYPELRANDFYLTAESYGGIYIPTFMREIDQRGGVPNFVGAAIGDGCWGTDVGLCAFGSGKSNEIQANFFLGHSMIDQPLFRGLERACANATTGEWADEADAPAECVDLLAQMDAQAGDFNVYNVYDTCADDAARGGASSAHVS